MEILNAEKTTDTEPESQAVEVEKTSTSAHTPHKGLGPKPDEILKSLAEAKEAILKAQERDESEATTLQQASLRPTPLIPRVDDERDGTLIPGQRKFRRVNCNVRAKMMQSGQPPEDVRLCDLSLGGIGLITQRNIPMASVCHVKFRLTMPSGHLFTVVAAAQAIYSAYNARQHGFKTGLRFGKLPDEAVAAITEFIADKTRSSAL